MFLTAVVSEIYTDQRGYANGAVITADINRWLGDAARKQVNNNESLSFFFFRAGLLLTVQRYTSFTMRHSRLKKKLALKELNLSMNLR